MSVYVITGVSSGIGVSLACLVAHCLCLIWPSLGSSRASPKTRRTWSSVWSATRLPLNKRWQQSWASVPTSTSSMETSPTMPAWSKPLPTLPRLLASVALTTLSATQVSPPSSTLIHLLVNCRSTSLWLPFEVNDVCSTEAKSLRSLTTVQTNYSRLMSPETSTSSTFSCLLYWRARPRRSSPSPVVMPTLSSSTISTLRILPYTLPPRRPWTSLWPSSAHNTRKTACSSSAWAREWWKWATLATVYTPVLEIEISGHFTNVYPQWLQNRPRGWWNSWAGLKPMRLTSRVQSP